MKKKTLTKTICFKTTPENFNYLKMFGNVNKKLNEFVTSSRISFEFEQQMIEFGSDSYEEVEQIIGNPSIRLYS